MAIDLLNKQLRQGDLISKFITNTNKMGPVTAEGLQQRIILVDQYWDGCLQTHRQLCLLQDGLKDDEYFKVDLFSTYEANFLQAKADLTTRLAQKIGELQATTTIPPELCGTCSCELNDLVTPQNFHYQNSVACRQSGIPSRNASALLSRIKPRCSQYSSYNT